MLDTVQYTWSVIADASYPVHNPIYIVIHMNNAMTDASRNAPI